MESLHVSFQQLIDRRLFTPIVVGKDNVVPISHLLYADDVMFIGKWSSENVNVLMMMLHWFFLASGLKINVQKSSLYCVGVRPFEVHSMAECYGCLANNLPFTYLGVKVPEGVLSHLESLRNSFFLGADLEDWKITWVCWRKVMANKHLGGLGVSSLFALNHALLFKRIWRFRSSQTGLWLNVIKAIHGIDGAIDRPPRYGASVWNKIIKATFSLKSKGVDLLQLKDKFNRCFKLDLQQHASIAFKLQNSDFASSFRRRPRLGIEEAQFHKLSNMLASVTLSSPKDRCSWSLVGSGVFSVKSAREEIDKRMLITSPSPTRWSKVLPIKINVFLWCMFLDKLPTQTNLYNRGIDIPCILCLNYRNGIETRNHLFFECSMVVDLFQLFGRWWNIQLPSFSDFSSWKTWFGGLRFSKLQKQNGEEILAGSMLFSLDQLEHQI
ncbi:RNA-directed DNA polymerase, eukaryota, reverse transcriptase zinc-binding domain protein [Tanacetum coccineum]